MAAFCIDDALIIPFKISLKAYMKREFGPQLAGLETMAVRLPRITRYQDARDMSGSTRNHEVTGKIMLKLSLLGYFGIVILFPNS